MQNNQSKVSQIISRINQNNSNPYRQRNQNLNSNTNLNQNNNNNVGVLQNDRLSNIQPPFYQTINQQTACSQIQTRAKNIGTTTNTQVRKTTTSTSNQAATRSELNAAKFIQELQENINNYNLKNSSLNEGTLAAGQFRLFENNTSYELKEDPTCSTNNPARHTCESSNHISKDSKRTPINQNTQNFDRYSQEGDNHHTGNDIDPLTRASKTQNFDFFNKSLPYETDKDNLNDSLLDKNLTNTTSSSNKPSPNNNNTNNYPINMSNYALPAMDVNSSNNKVIHMPQYLKNSTCQEVSYQLKSISNTCNFQVPNISNSDPRNRPEPRDLQPEEPCSTQNTINLTSNFVLNVKEDPYNGYFPTTFSNNNSGSNPCTNSNSSRPIMKSIPESLNSSHNNHHKNRVCFSNCTKNEDGNIGEFKILFFFKKIERFFRKI